MLCACDVLRHNIDYANAIFIKYQRIHHLNSQLLSVKHQSAQQGVVECPPRDWTVVGSILGRVIVKTIKMVPLSPYWAVFVFGIGGVRFLSTALLQLTASLGDV